MLRAAGVLLALLVGACDTESAGTSSFDAQATEPVDGYVDVGGINLHYRDYGGEGDLLVFVPGFYMTAHVYDQLAPRFTDRYRVLALTYRGHGTSDTTGLGFDLDAIADDVAGFIDHFTDDPAVVVGWATAGLVLPKLARQRPDLVKALVFANAVWASVPVPEGLPRWLPGRTTPDDSVYPSVEAAAEQYQGLMSITSTEAVMGVMAGALYRREDGMYAWLPPVGARAEEALAYYDSAAVYDGLDVPILAIQVKQSNALVAEYEARGIVRDTIDLAVRWIREYYDVSLDLGVEALRAAVPDAEVIVLDDLNHNYMIENPDVVARIIGDFLGRLGNQAAAQVPEPHPFRARFASVPRMEAEVIPVRSSEDPFAVLRPARGASVRGKRKRKPVHESGQACAT